MNYEFDIEQLQDYIEDLCAKNRAVAHSNTRRCFARHQSFDQINEIKKAAGNVCVVVAGVDGRRVGGKDDQMFERTITLRIAANAQKVGDATAAKAAAEKLAESILLDFMTRMEHDQEDNLENNVCGPMHFLRPENFSWEPIEDAPWLINHYGWDLTIPFHHYMPAYDADKWSD